MHARRPPEALLALGALVVALAVALGAAFGLGRQGKPAAAAAVAPSWRGLVGQAPAAVSTAQRMIVVLKAPSLAERVAAAGGLATETQERAWTAAAFAVQQQVLTYLALRGMPVRPDYAYARVLNGFAATLDPRAVALLQQTKQVDAIYPVRAAYPASLGGAAGKGAAQGVSLPGFTGRGVTIALLDTGVDRSHPFLGGRVLPGFDLVDRGSDASARPDPQSPGSTERHGTELAGLLAGSHGPGGLHGVAPDATILPLRVAGWQPDTAGRDLVYARTDQVLAGLDKAVDPNGDGDAHDAVRLALVGVSEPYASFADGVEARAVQGALALNTLVVAPAGNSGAAGPTFGSVGAPAGVPGALAVGSTDGRARTTVVRVVLRRGLDVLFDGQLPVAGAVAPTRRMKLAPAEARTTANGAVEFFDQRGVSVVAGKAAFAPAGSDPLGTALTAARAKAAVLLLYGNPLPAGSLRAVSGLGIPVVVVPAGPALAVLAAQRAGIDTGVSLGPAAAPANADAGKAAPFSSRGLAFDGRVKPDLAAPGVALATSEPRTAANGKSPYGSISGTSASAATVAGAAALLVQMRPSLDGPALASLLAGYAREGGSSVETGAGVLDLGASAVGEVAAAPTTLAFGVWDGPKWKSTQTLVVRNVSTRPLELSLSAVSGGDSEALRFVLAPDRLALGPGKSAEVAVTVSADAAPQQKLVTGDILVAPAGSATLRVPWAIVFDQPAAPLLEASLDHSSFKPSDARPAILTVHAGAVLNGSGPVQVEPVALLDLLLYDARGRFLGRLARVRDVLPGSYTFGITGRGPTTIVLPPGRYEIRIAAWPTLPENAHPARAKVRFTIT